MKTTTKTAAKKLNTMSRKIDAMIEGLQDLREDGGKDAEGLDVVFVADLLDRAFSLRSALDRRAATLTETPAPAQVARDVYEVMEEQNSEALRRMA